MTLDSKARQVANYSLPVVFANDDTTSAGELGMLKRLALRDGTVDEEERANVEHENPAVQEEIARFLRQYDI